MNSREMHYDFKQKLNKIDSQKYRNLIVPEIDWKLNEAQEVFIKMIAEPRLRSGLGFETSQRSIDDIRAIVVNQSLDTDTCLEATKFDEESYTVTLPENYWFYLSSDIYADKGDCSDVRLDAVPRQHDDTLRSVFDKSSFEWRKAQIRFIDNRIRIFTDKTFEISHLCLNYIRRPLFIQNAQDYVGGQYNRLDGTVLTGFQNCELPVGTHSEIVDIAILITTGDLQIQDYQIKLNKTKISN